MRSKTCRFLDFQIQKHGVITPGATIFNFFPPAPPLVKLLGRKYRLSNSPVVNSPAEYSPEEKYPMENSTVFIKCFFYTSFNKNEVRTFHRIKFIFACFLKSFLLRCALGICSNCESVGSLGNIGQASLIIYEPCHITSVYFLKQTLLKGHFRTSSFDKKLSF